MLYSRRRAFALTRGGVKGFALSPRARGRSACCTRPHVCHLRGVTSRDLKAKEPELFLRVGFVGSKVLKVRSRVPWSSRVFATNAEWSLKSSSLIRADDLTIAIARVEANVQNVSSLP